MSFRAYSVAENEKLSVGVHNRAMFEQEKLLALDFVENNRSSLEHSPCPACESDSSEFFAEFTGVKYLRCRNCLSIFTPVEREIIDRYRRYSPLRDFRASAKYQERSSEKREHIWNEMCFWIKFRISRYLGKKDGLSVVDIGERYEKLAQILSSVSDKYQPIEYADEIKNPADVILYFNQMTFEPNPSKALKSIRQNLNPDGLLFLSTRVGSGFDILTLKGGIDNIYPYEHSFLPSTEGLEILLKKAGYELLELSTPGSLDMQYVVENGSKLDKKDLFARYLLEKTDESTLSEFQRFLQKSGISSHAQLVARAREDGEHNEI